MPQAIEQVLLNALAVVVLLSLLWMLFGGCLPWLRHRARAGNGPVLLFYGLLAFMMGLYGWSANGTAEGYIDAMYLSVQHLYLNAPQEGADHWAVQISRLFAIASVVLIGAEVIRRLFEDSIQSLALLLARKRVVIIGFGDTGATLFREIVEMNNLLPAEFAGVRKKHIVVIELDGGNEQIGTAKTRGASVIVGNGLDRAILKRAGAHRASCVFFTMASDQRNTDAVAAISELRRERQVQSHVSWYVHLRDTGLERVLARVLRVKGERKWVHLQTFNVLDLAARDAVEQCLTDLRPVEDRQVFHCIIVGFGKMGQLLTRRIAESAHFENLKRTRITVVYSANEQDQISDFCGRHPAIFGEQCGHDPWNPNPDRDEWSYEESGSGVSFVCNGGFVRDGAAPRSRVFMDQIMAVAKTNGVLPTVFLCADSNEDDSAAFALRTELDSRFNANDAPGEPAHPVHIFSYIPTRPPIAYATERLGLTMFGAVSTVCTLEALAGSLDRKLAEAFARRYNDRMAQEQSESDDLDGWEIASNLAAARHVHAKLAVLGLCVSSVREGFTPTPIVVEVSQQNGGGPDHSLSTTLAKMEHNRWMAERLMDGWRFGPGSNELRLRASMLDWSKLPEAERKTDQDQISEALLVCSDSNRFVLSQREARLKWGAGHAALSFMQDHRKQSLVIGWTGPHKLEDKENGRDALGALIGTLGKSQRAKIGVAAEISAIGSIANDVDLMVIDILVEQGLPYDLELPMHTQQSDKIEKMIKEARSVERKKPTVEQDQQCNLLGEQIVTACDVLIAVWDGEPSREMCETAAAVRLARSKGKPVITISPDDGSAWYQKPDLGGGGA